MRFTFAKSTLIYALVIVIALFISGLITYQKFALAEQIGMSIGYDKSFGYEYGITDEAIILHVDEIKYLTWSIFREGSIDRIFKLDSVVNLNLWGIIVSSIYFILGSWKLMFLLGLFGYMLYVHSTIRLVKHFCYQRYHVFLITFFVLSPVAINLSSGFMRDLIIYSIVSYSLVNLDKRLWGRFIICVILIFLLRSFYLFILIPLYIYLFSKNLRTSLLIFFLQLPLGYQIVNSNRFGSGDASEVFFRLLELMTGASKVFYYLPNQNILSSNFFEYLSAYYFLISLILFALLVLDRGARLSKTYFIIICVGLLLCMFYGLTLGFFVARTKFIFTIILLVFTVYDSDSRMRGLNEVK